MLNNPLFNIQQRSAQQSTIQRTTKKCSTIHYLTYSKEVLNNPLYNIQQRSAQQCTIQRTTKKCSTVHYLCSWTILLLFKNTEHFQKKTVLSWSRNCCSWYQCGTFKREWNSVVTIRSKCCRSFFLRNITVWNYLLRNLLKIKLSEIGFTFTWLFSNK